MLDLMSGAEWTFPEFSVKENAEADVIAPTSDRSRQHQCPVPGKDWQ
jgi:hypothetical protein